MFFQKASNDAKELFCVLFWVFNNLLFVFSVILETNVMVVKKDFVVFEKGIKDVGKTI